MGTSIGEVNINLRMSLAKFSEDVKQGTRAAGDGARGIADGFKSSSRESQASLALIGEEIGVTIPRHIRGFISAIPGVGTALNAAFSSIAVIALIEVIAKVVEKIQAYRDHLAEAADAWDKVGQQGKDALTALDSQILALNIRLDELRGDHIAALRDELTQIQQTKLQALGTEFDKLGKSADDAFKKMQVGWAASFIGFGNDKGVQMVAAAFNEMLVKIKELENAGDADGVKKLVDDQVAAVQKSIQQIESFNGASTAGGKAIEDALKDELKQLQLMTTVYEKLNTVADKKTGVVTMTDQARATAEAAKRTKELADDLKEVMTFLDSKEANAPRRGGPQQPTGTADPSEIFGLGGITKGIGAGNPLYGGTKQAKDELDLLTNQNQQLQMASDLYTATRTSEEKYANEMQTLNTLLASGAIDQDTYNRAVTQAKEKYDDVTRGLEEIGRTVGQNIAQAALYGGSWSKAFQDIAIQIGLVILKMTLLKQLQTAAAAGGGGGALGIFSSILGGITGHATGGPVYQGEGYMVGERGPEFFSPKTSGTIIPNHQLQSGDSSAPVVNQVEVHVHGVTDVDSFKKSSGQIAASMANALVKHQRRNG